MREPSRAELKGPITAENGPTWTVTANNGMQYTVDITLRHSSAPHRRRAPRHSSRSVAPYVSAAQPTAIRSPPPVLPHPTAPPAKRIIYTTHQLIGAGGR
ncbi:MAG TPA: hypothetical protein VGP04_06680, partial [Pseudonocardiaceae bacterium]|nr:hypothetical protein [Pseudonocardiaceae bacterium]